MPEAYAELMKVREKLEQHYRDMQDIEFTVQQRKLYMLQTRNGKRTAAASLRIAVDMAREGLIDESEAVRRVNPASLDQLLHPTLDPKAPRTLLATGLPASPGAASGAAVFTADEAESRAQTGEAIILVRIETSPEDIHGMHAARGILTTRGGMTSHAAVVARGMGRPCVAGAGGISIDYHAQTLSAGGKTVRAGETITLDGTTGEVFVGNVAMIEPAMSTDFATLMEWADKSRRLKVRANAETPLDAETARKYGAEGIGLCRTEHMFFDPERISAVRQMIMAPDEAGRRTALAKLLPFQRNDFHRPVPHHGRSAGHHPPARSAAARVPAARRRRAGGGRAFAGREPRRHAPPRRGTGRGQPDARPSRLPAGDRLSGNLRDAGARDLRGRADRGEGDRQGADAGDHDPAGG